MNLFKLTLALFLCELKSVAAARPSLVEAANICGSLGVMNTTELGPDVNLDEVRLCREHPMGKTSPYTQPGAVGEDKLLDKRSCWYGKEVGCSNGYCFKTCGIHGNGDWCWTAHGDTGMGPWIKCLGDSQCSSYATCAGGGCKSCGCGC